MLLTFELLGYIFGIEALGTPFKALKSEPRGGDAFICLFSFSSMPYINASTVFLQGIRHLQDVSICSNQELI